MVGDVTLEFPRKHYNYLLELPVPCRRFATEIFPVPANNSISKFERSDDGH